MISREQCIGCRDDFYNQGNNSNTKRCWSAQTGKMVTKFKLGWWAQPDQPKAYTEVKVPSCYHQPGKFAFHEKLPNFVKAEDVVRKVKDSKS